MRIRNRSAAVRSRNLAAKRRAGAAITRNRTCGRMNILVALILLVCFHPNVYMIDPRLLSHDDHAIDAG